MGPITQTALVFAIDDSKKFRTQAWAARKEGAKMPSYQAATGMRGVVRAATPAPTMPADSTPSTNAAAAP